MITRMILVTGVLAFAIGCTLTALLRQFVLHRDQSHQTLSDRLTGPWAALEVAGYAALAVALIILGIALNGPVTWLAWATGAGVSGAMLSDSFPRLMRSAGFKHLHKVHIGSAALAFVAALALEASLAHGPLLWALTVAYPLAVGAMYVGWPENTSWQEDAAASAIVAYLLAFALT